MVKKLSPEEQEKFWAKVETHAKNLQDNPGMGNIEQRTMFDTLFHLKLELAPASRKNEMN